MTDMQISLIVIGVAVVGGVIGYNKLQEARAKKNVERAFSDGPDDVLMEPTVKQTEIETPTVAERVEPTLAGDELVPVEDEVEQQVTAIQEPMVDDEPEQDLDAEDETPPVAQPKNKEPLIDPGIDCAIPIPFDEDVRGERLLPILQGLSHVGNKPVHFMGLMKDAGDSSGNWEPILHGYTYQAIQAGVQMANRSSALGEIEYSELLVRLREIADELDADPEIPDMPVVMEQSRALRQFVIDHDAKLSINIRSNAQPWKISTLMAVLERQGFDVRPDGRFEMSDVGGSPLFILLTNENVAAEYTARLTLLLDVPRVAPGQEGFSLMAASAKTLAERLNGTVVDDGDQPLTDDMLAQISEQVQAFYQEMESAGVPAGSVRALRLFD